MNSDDLEGETVITHGYPACDRNIQEENLIAGDFHQTMKYMTLLEI